MARSGGRPNQRLAAVPPPCRALEQAVLVPALRAGVQAQARARWWVGPGTDMGQAVQHRAIMQKYPNVYLYSTQDP